MAGLEVQVQCIELNSQRTKHCPKPEKKQRHVTRIFNHITFFHIMCKWTLNLGTNTASWGERLSQLCSNHQSASLSFFFYFFFFLVSLGQFCLQADPFLKHIYMSLEDLRVRDFKRLSRSLFYSPRDNSKRLKYYWDLKLCAKSFYFFS